MRSTSITERRAPSARFAVFLLLAVLLALWPTTLAAAATTVEPVEPGVSIELRITRDCPPGGRIGASLAPALGVDIVFGSLYGEVDEAVMILDPSTTEGLSEPGFLRFELQLFCVDADDETASCFVVHLQAAPYSVTSVSPIECPLSSGPANGDTTTPPPSTSPVGGLPETGSPAHRTALIALLLTAGGALMATLTRRIRPANDS